MKIVKMLSPHTDHFDGYMRSQLDHAEVDTQLAGKYIGDMQFPVPVTTETPGGWKAFLNKHKRTFFFWITAALFTGTLAWYITRPQNGSPQDKAVPEANSAPVATTPVAGPSDTRNSTGTENETSSASQAAAGTEAVVNNGNQHTGSTVHTPVTDRSDIPAQLQADAQKDHQKNTSGVIKNTKAPAVDVQAGSLAVSPPPGPAAVIDSATKKIRDQKLHLKKDTVNIIW